MAKYRMNKISGFLRLSRALSDENRVRILMCLQDGELCLCQIINLLGLAPSTVSKHMAVLRDAGLLESRKDGRWHSYRMMDREASSVTRSTILWMVDALDGDETINEDARKLEGVLRKDKEDLCECYKS